MTLSHWILIFSLSLPVLAHRDVEVKFLRSYDGDTFYVEIPDLKKYDRGRKLGIFWDEIGVRVLGIDTPEIRGASCAKEKELAQKAKELVESALSKAKHIRLRNLQKDKYFRLLADVLVDGKSLSEMLIKEDLAVLYDGGTKTNPWCASGR